MPFPGFAIGSLLQFLPLLTVTVAESVDSVSKTSYRDKEKIAAAQPASAPSRSADGVPPVVKSAVGDSSAGWDGRLKMVNIGKRQQYDYSQRSTLDYDIYSPKSVNFSPSGDVIYVNSLEGGKTVVYTVPDLTKKAVIHHTFSFSGEVAENQTEATGGNLWSIPSGHYPFIHYTDGHRRAFTGKPVEGVFSHNGRYFWVPYYRRTFDINAQDPSAIAVIDTRSDSIIKMFETGPLPKMVAYNPQIAQIAITHWGDNTVGFINVESDNPLEWHHLEPLTAGSKLHLDFPLDRSIDRDANSGYKLRGTVYTPDGNYLLVSSMGGPLHIFDVKDRRYLGYVNSAYGVRHLLLHDHMLYGSQNIAATVIGIPLDSILSGISRAKASDSRSIIVNGWRRCKVGGGARTIDISPDGKLLFAACNSASEICVVETDGMSLVDRIRVDSYPVGLDVSDDGTLMAVTSQGRKGHGGNALNLFRIIRPDIDNTPTATNQGEQPVENFDDELSDDTNVEIKNKKFRITDYLPLSLSAGAFALLILLVFVIRSYSRNSSNQDDKPDNQD